MPHFLKKLVSKVEGLLAARAAAGCVGGSIVFDLGQSLAVGSTRVGQGEMSQG